MNSLKQTIYFISSNNYPINQLNDGLKEICIQKEEWLTKNKETISKIENEDLKIIQFSNNSSHALFLMQLSYYTK